MPLKKTSQNDITRQVELNNQTAAFGEARRALVQISADMNNDVDNRRKAATTLFEGTQQYYLMRSMEKRASMRWHEATLKELVPFFLRLALALVPAGLLVFLVYVTLYLSAVVLTNVMR